MKRRSVKRRREARPDRELPRANLGTTGRGPVFFHEGSQVLAPPSPEEQLVRRDEGEFLGREGDREPDVVEQMRRSR